MARTVPSPFEARPYKSAKADLYGRAPHGGLTPQDDEENEDAVLNSAPVRICDVTDQKWKHDGVRVIPGHALDPNTAQTPGMDRKVAIDFARAGAQRIWAGTVAIKPNAKTGAHHHGALESVIYVVRGRARMRWGDRLEFVAEAGPGDFIYVPPYVPHQEINAAPDEPLECVLVRSGQDAVVVNLDIPVVEKPEAVYWVDPIHRDPHS